MKLLKKISFSGFFLLFAVNTFAQDTDTGTKNFMTDNGKIMVVLAVVVVIVLGLFIYLINLDRKITKLEKNTKP